MELEDAIATTTSAAEYSAYSTIEAGAETRGMDSPVLGVVESSPANFVPHRLGLGELRDEELESILRCIKSLPYRESANAILQDLALGRKAAFRLSPGLMILEIIQRGEEKELFVYWLEGKNMFKQLRFIKDAVMRIATANGCTRLGAAPLDIRWAKKLVKSFGGALTGYLVSVEI